MIQALAADGADEAFCIAVLPRTAWRGQDFLQAHALHPLVEVLAVDLVAVAQQVARVDYLKKCSTLRGSRATTMSTKRTRQITVGTVKKSMATVSLR